MNPALAIFAVSILLLFVWRTVDIHNGELLFPGIAAREFYQPLDTNNQNGDSALVANEDSATQKRTTLFSPCPESSRKLVWLKGSRNHKLYEPVYRAFHSRGWSVTRDLSRAHVLWTDQPKRRDYDFYLQLQDWQRYNHFPGTYLWDDKDELVLGMNQYYSSSNTEAWHAFPESYVLHLNDGLEAFRRRLLFGGGIDIPWVLKEPTVNKGKGVSILGPRSEALIGLVDRIQNEQQQQQQKDKRWLIQRYICDEMTWDHRKFDVRVFWAVISIDPLIAVYQTQQNYVRIGHTVYDEDRAFSHPSNNSPTVDDSTKAHLTTHTFGSAEAKATWDEFRERIEAHVLDPSSEFHSRFLYNNHTTIDAIRRDPFGHVQNQIKTTIAHLVDAYKNSTFANGRASMGKPQNGFSWHAADVVVDNNLDVFVIEGTDGPGKDEDYDFRIRMHDGLLGSLVDILEEVVKRQESGKPLSVEEMKEDGILGGYEVVYNDGWISNYRYDRLQGKECGRSHDINLEPRTQQPPNGLLPVLSSAPQQIHQATLTALPRKKQEEGNYKKNFWMKSRTTRSCEPVARSFRRKGWSPVDHPDDAQVVYLPTEAGKDIWDKLRQWQLVSQFPSQFSFFDSHYRQYLDSTASKRKMDESGACRPIVHQNQPIEIRVYWFVLSLDPLMVLYHDGYIHFPYSKHNEGEFVTLPGRQHGNLNSEKERVWRGAWRNLEQILYVARDKTAGSVPEKRSKAATAAAAIEIDPILHAKNQMKHKLVIIAQGFQSYTQKMALSNATFTSFAIFQAKFEIDQDMNVFFKDSSHSHIEGEDHSEIVTIHNDVYGAAVQLLEHFHSKIIVNSSSTAGDELLGGFEWLISDANRAQNATFDYKMSERHDQQNSKGNKTYWDFQYDWKYNAHECFE